MGIMDMNLGGSKLGKDVTGNNYSSLDHGVLENAANCKQDDGYNCDILLCQ